VHKTYSHSFALVVKVSQCSAQHQMLPHHLVLFIRIVIRTAAAAATE